MAELSRWVHFSQIENERRHGILFVACTVALCAATVAGTMGDLTLRSAWVDYESLAEGERVVGLAADPAATDYLKLNYMERGPRYAVGAFGMVHTAAFSRVAFDSAGSTYFNYYTHFASLPDLVAIVAHVANAGRMPKNAVIVQIPNPRLNGGAYLLEPSRQLAHPALFLASEGWLQRMNRWRRVLLNQLSDRLSLRRLYGALTEPIPGFVVVDPRRCVATGGSAPGRVRVLLAAVARRVGLGAGHDTTAEAVRMACAMGELAGQGKDGSLLDARNQQLSAARAFPRTGMLGENDVEGIATMLTAINGTIAATGARPIFWVAPIASTDGADENVPLNRVLDRALATLPSLHVIDTRYTSNDLRWFAGDDKHPNARFFGWLVAEIRRRGWI